MRQLPGLVPAVSVDEADKMACEGAILARWLDELGRAFWRVGIGMLLEEFGGAGTRQELEDYLGCALKFRYRDDLKGLK